MLHLLVTPAFEWSTDTCGGSGTKPPVRDLHLGAEVWVEESLFCGYRFCGVSGWRRRVCRRRLTSHARIHWPIGGHVACVQGVQDTLSVLWTPRQSRLHGETGEVKDHKPRERNENASQEGTLVAMLVRPETCSYRDAPQRNSTTQSRECRQDNLGNRPRTPKSCGWISFLSLPLFWMNVVQKMHDNGRAKENKRHGVDDCLLDCNGPKATRCWMLFVSLTKRHFAQLY